MARAAAEAEAEDRKFSSYATRPEGSAVPAADAEAAAEDEDEDY